MPQHRPSQDHRHTDRSMFYKHVSSAYFWPVGDPFPEGAGAVCCIPKEEEGVVVVGHQGPLVGLMHLF